MSSNIKQSGASSSPIINDNLLQELWASDPQYKQKRLLISDPGIPLRDGDYESLDLLPGCDIVGCGYDVLHGFYADVRSCLRNLFDFNSGGMSKVAVAGTSYAKPSALTVHPRYATSTYVYTGKTFDEFNSSISSQTKLEGGYSFFSASVEVDIGISEARSMDKEFSKVQSNVEMFVLQLPLDHKKMLKAEVKEDIDTMEDLDKLFDTYGTHYLSSIIMGGHATYSSSTTKSKFQSTFELGVVASMAFKSTVGSISASEDMKYKKDIQSFNESSTVKIQTSGGDPGLGGPDLPNHLGDWLNSVKDYMTLADFVETFGLWRLASSAPREQQLQDHYFDYCKRKESQYTSGIPLRLRLVPVTNVIDQWFPVGTPDVGGSWSYLGQIGGGYGSTFVLQETEPGSGVLTDIARWEKICDYGDYSFWRGIPANPVDYAVLSDFCQLGHDPPKAENAAGLKAVHKSCLASASVSLDPSEGSLGYSFIFPFQAPYPASLKHIRRYYVILHSTSVIEEREVYVLKSDRVQVEN